MTRLDPRCAWMACAATLALCTPAAAAGPDPRQPYIMSLAYSGSGCPQGTVGQSIANDRQTFTLIFDTNIASLGPEAPITATRKNCLITLRVHTPAGYTWAALDFRARGYAQLDRGVHGQSRAEIGDPLRLTTSVDDFYGPSARDYVATNRRFALFNSGSCGQEATILINQSASLFNGGGSSEAAGQLSIDSLDGQVRHLLSFDPESDTEAGPGARIDPGQVIIPCDDLAPLMVGRLGIEQIAETIGTNLDTNVSSRASQESVDAIAASMDRLGTAATLHARAIQTSIVGLVPVIQTRASQDSVNRLGMLIDNLTSSLATSSSITALQASVANLEPILNGKASQESVDAAVRAEKRVAIERALSDGAKPVSFMLPASAGGQLETVREVVSDMMAAVRLMGGDVSKASSEFAKGEAAFAAGDYRSAFGWYASAYQRLQK